MKTLYMARHAKSSWKYDLPDHQRPLKKRGHKDASLVSEKAKTDHKPPEKIISSDANRAQTTAMYFKKAFGVSDENYILNHDLYDFSGQSVMEIIKGLDNSLKRVMIVGHNHAFTSIVNMLGNEYIDNLPTSGFVIIKFPVDSWSEITTGKTKTLLFPRHLKE
ncbi:MAG: histidine phosphatase family protein [Bacteroidia bacterium]|nr:histidine phosphatase family protein [Bacteroidia bacterium]NNF31280.1 histidine phosphatase family protein [Flavobacteriaceae bacterium]MBT8274628.1 histidine phosphatase family protein [Bacteroidia bacterium]NNJ82673.1 histidine phosphatase family protein [Flavobacteriaceae bacterium]NNK54202.1 histidine phosphatase family protein [Flavobacteriaceae bacterium]